MAQPFFGRREPEPAALRPASANALSGTASSASPVASSTPLVQPGTGLAPAAGKDVGSTLTVGPNIKLKGVEITDCDTLLVEGMVEATMNSRVMQISEQGAFKGAAEIDIAEIRGLFEGSLTVRQKLVIYATGKVTGKIRYGKLVIEEGGQITGDIQFGTSVLTPPAEIYKPLSGTSPAASRPPLHMAT